MKIYFLRHGEAGYQSASDNDRKLTTGGIESSKAVAQFCRKLELNFTAIYTSPILRAQQTAECIQQHYPHLTVTSSGYLTPDANPDDILRDLTHHTNDSSILLVTHEPFASNCISMLIHGTDQLRIVMKTTSLACVEIDGIVSRGTGRLLWLASSENIRRLLS